MHKILLKEDARPIRQQQRRLNLTILDVVKKEITKLLVAGIIYPISDSQWVSPIQVVLKKSGMTVIKNQQDEMRCMINIFSDLLEEYMEVFMDDFTDTSSQLEISRRFIKDFSKITLPLSKLLQKDVDFIFDQPCVDAFQELKRRLTTVPILQAPN
ncbi:hypothetical protein CR513_38316, partial [Mucuna pruriens]